MWWFFLSSCLVVTQAYIPPQHLFKGDNATLECGNASPDAMLLEWLLPTNVVISETYDRFIIGDGLTSTSLHITELRMEDNGEYRCVYQLPLSPDKKVEIILLKVRDTYIKELEDWQANVTRGAVSAAVMACFFVSICAIHKYRWRSPEENHPSSARSSITVKRQSQIPRASLQGVDNPALSEEPAVVESAM